MMTSFATIHINRGGAIMNLKRIHYFDIVRMTKRFQTTLAFVSHECVNVFNEFGRHGLIATLPLFASLNSFVKINC